MRCRGVLWSQRLREERDSWKPIKSRSGGNDPCCREPRVWELLFCCYYSSCFPWHKKRLGRTNLAWKLWGEKRPSLIGPKNAGCDMKNRTNQICGGNSRDIKRVKESLQAAIYNRQWYLHSPQWSGTEVRTGAVEACWLPNSREVPYHDLNWEDHDKDILGFVKT